MIPERKAEARLRARAVRKALPPAVRVAKARRVADAVLALPEVRAASAVACYVSVHSEVETRDILAALVAQGKRVLVPVVTPPERLHLAPLGNVEELRAGPHGIPEPASAVIVDEADAFLVPGLLFTPNGHRLGQGGGYFDRLLRRAPRAPRIGLAYDEQIVPELPLDAHDERMDVVVTDARILRASPARSE